MNFKTVKSISKVFENVNKERNSSYSDFKHFSIQWNSSEPYQLIKRIGKGKYSDVFLGNDTQNDNDVVIKVLKPVAESKIRREVKILQNLRGHPNIITLLDVTMSDHKIPSLIFEYINSPEYSKFFEILTLFEIQFYMHDLAEALLYAHSNGIMHRDIKPYNIIVDFPRRIVFFIFYSLLKLIDWGLAEFYHPGTPYNCRVASRPFKSPELLVDYRIFKKEHIFFGSDNHQQLLKIVSVFGTEVIQNYLVKYRHIPSADLLNQINGFAPKTLKSYINPSNSHLAHSTAMSLLKACLTVDHSNRPTVQEILSHDFFKQTFNSNNSLVNSLT